MYAPSGLAQSELGKFDVIVADDRLHLFALTLPNHDVVLHAVSDDGLAWQALPNALYCGDPGAYDDDEIWSVGVISHDGAYTMLYTALARADEGLVQRIVRATSSDLVHWTKHVERPVAEPDPRWYAAAPRPDGRVSWRDAKPLWIGETCFAPLCAHAVDGPFLRRGCVGLLVSDDLVTWEVRPPLFRSHVAWDLECPQLVRVGPSWLLLASVAEDRSQRYWTASHYAGPFGVAPGGNRLGPAGHYAGRMVRWRGVDLLISQVSGDAIRPGFSHRQGKYVAPPLAVSRRDDGSLACRSFAGWSNYQSDVPRPVRPDARSAFGGVPSDSWHLQAGGALDVLASATEEYSDCWIDGTLVFEAVNGGLAIGLDSRGGGLFVEFTEGSAEVSLQRWQTGALMASDRPFHYSELQRGRLAEPIKRAQRVRFTLMRVGQYFECAVEGDVILALFLGGSLVGRVGIWAVGGSVSATALNTAGMRVPEHR